MLASSLFQRVGASPTGSARTGAEVRLQAQGPVAQWRRASMSLVQAVSNCWGMQGRSEQNAEERPSQRQMTS